MTLNVSTNFLVKIVHEAYITHSTIDISLSDVQHIPKGGGGGVIKISTSGLR